MTNFLTKWVPFRLACRLRSLQQGSLNVGNTQQNITNLKNLAITNAQLNGGRGGTWAKWGPNFGPLSAGKCTTSTAGLLIFVEGVPGFIAPGVSHVLDEVGNLITDEAGNEIIAG